jgi:hypothetical protein
MPGAPGVADQNARVRRPSITASRGRVPTGPLVVATVAAVAGLALRFLVLASVRLRSTDSDEAIIGLIGLRATHGHVDVMFWGQAYGGTIESFVVAPLFALFGPSVLVERLLLLVIGAVAAVLTWRVGRRLVGEPAAIVGAGVQWTMSSYFVWWSTKINIYYGALCLALVVVLCVLQLRDDDAPPWWAAAFGLAAGAAAWSNPQTLYLLVPVVLLHARPMLRAWRRVLAAVPFALVGFSPWLVYSVRNDFSTLKFPGVDVYLPYPERVLLFVRELPIVFGARAPLNDEWLVSTTLFRVAVVVAVAGLLWGLVRDLPGLRSMLVLTDAYALLFGLSPQVGQPGARLQPRYLLFVTPVLALGIGALLARVRWRRLPVLGLAAILLATGLSAMGLRRMDDEGLTLTSGGPEATVPADLSPLLAVLRQHGITRAYSFYWLSYRTTFETGEQVIVAPAFVHISRFKPYADAVEASDRPAVIAMRASKQVAAIEARLDALGIGHQRYERGAFAVIVPSADVPREEYVTAFREAGVFA